MKLPNVFLIIGAILGIVLPIAIFVYNQKENIKMWREEKQSMKEYYKYIKEYIKDVPDYPFTFFLKLVNYQKYSSILSLKAKTGILWTIYGSPLFVNTPKDQHLTKYDVAFVENYCKIKDKENSEEKCKKNIRLVILRDKEETEAYKNCDKRYHGNIKKKDLIERKQAFISLHNNSHKCQLLFTRADLLLNNYDFKKVSPTEINLEFGFVRWGDEIEFSEGKKCFGFESGFDSRSLIDSKARRFTLFNMKDDNGCFYTDRDHFFRNINLQKQIAKDIYLDDSEIHKYLFTSEEIEKLCKI